MIEISPVVYEAIKIIETVFDGTEVKLIIRKMYRINPDEYSPVGKLGVDVEIMRVKTFLSYQIAEDIVLNPYGYNLAEQFVFDLMKYAYPEKFK